MLRPALLAGLFLVEVIGPHVAELMDRIGDRRAKPLTDSRPRDDEFGATIHRQHREVWATCAATTATFLGNPRIPRGRRPG